MILNEATIRAYKEILDNPIKYGLGFKPIKESCEESDKVIAKHELFEQYINYIERRPLPKIIFYIIMDDLFPKQGKDEKGCVGYYLKLINP